MTNTNTDAARTAAKSQLETKPAATAVAALCLGVAFLIGRWAFVYVAELERIRDLRAGQVTTFFGVMLITVWIVTVAMMLVRRERSDTNRGPAARKVLAITSGILTGTTLGGLAVVLVASLATVIVTPPAAWALVCSTASLGAITHVQAFEGRGR